MSYDIEVFSTEKPIATGLGRRVVAGRSQSTVR
jgi:hypothetical protein